MTALLIACTVDCVTYGQDPFYVNLINVYKDQTETRREESYVKRVRLVALQPLIPTESDFQELTIECYESGLLTEAELDYIQSSRTQVCDTQGYTDDPTQMLSEWGMNPNDPYTIMMIQYMQGPWMQESMWNMYRRLLNKGDAAKDEAIIQDQLNALYEVSYQYAISVKNSAVAEGLPEYYMMMYDMMISWSENQLMTGYIASSNKWQKALSAYTDCESTSIGINSRYFGMKNILDFAKASQ